jgi:transcriptional regulator with XRE-family HTH domain
MTFGEKIQRLRKEAGLSQEELAYQLGVSRQAVSKWERDSGYPETEKLLRMAKLFHASLEDLLGEGDTQPANACNEPGMYVSRETATGFLFHQKGKWGKIAAGVGIMVGSLSFSFLATDLSMVLLMAAWVLGLVLLFSARLADDPYGKLWQEPLLFDKVVKGELNAAYAEKKGLFHGLQLGGIALMAGGLLLFPLLLPGEGGPWDERILAAGMLLAGAGIFLLIYMTGQIRSYRLLLMNETYQKKKARPS